MGPDIGELTRQYQAALEHLRAVTQDFSDLFSMSDEVSAVKDEVSAARRELELAWLAR